MIRHLELTACAPIAGVLLVVLAGMLVGCDPQAMSKPDLFATSNTNVNSTGDAESTANSGSGDISGNENGAGMPSSNDPDHTDGGTVNAAETPDPAPVPAPTPPPETRLRPGLAAVEVEAQGATKEEADWAASERAIARMIRAFYPVVTLDVLQQTRGWAACVQAGIAWSERLHWAAPTDDGERGTIRLLLAVELDAVGAWCLEELGDAATWSHPTEVELQRYVVAVGHYQQNRLSADAPTETPAQELLALARAAVDKAGFSSSYFHETVRVDGGPELALADVGDMTLGLSLRFEPGPDGTGIYHVAAIARHAVTGAELGSIETASDPATNETDGINQAVERAVANLRAAMVETVGREKRVGRPMALYVHAPSPAVYERAMEAASKAVRAVSRDENPGSTLMRFFAWVEPGWDVYRTLDEIGDACARDGLNIDVLAVRSRAATLEVVER